MGYYPDFANLDLSFLRKRLEGVEPIPSQAPLFEGLGAKLAALKKAGISDLAELSAALKGTKGPARLSLASGIDEGYLVLLRRAVEGMKPKPQPLSSFPGADAASVEALAARGIHDSAELYDAAFGKKERAALAARTGMALPDLSELVELSGLCRIQWVGPAYSSLLHAAGFRTAAMIAAANPERLKAEVSEANGRLRVSKTEIGLKDSARLVALAGFLAGSEGPVIRES